MDVEAHPFRSLGRPSEPAWNKPKIGPKLQASTRIEPNVGESRTITVSRYKSDPEEEPDRMIKDGQNLRAWIEKEYTQDRRDKLEKLKAFYAQLGVGWYSEKHQDPRVSDNGKITIDINGGKPLTLFCRHYSLAYINDRKGLLEAAGNSETLKSYAEKNTSKYFSDNAYRRFVWQTAVVMPRRSFGRLICSLFGEMERQGRLEFSAMILTQDVREQSSHATAFHLQIKGHEPPIYCVHCYDPNKTGTELTYELTRERLWDVFNSESADDMTFFGDYYPENPVMSLLSPRGDSEILFSASVEFPDPIWPKELVRTDLDRNTQTIISALTTLNQKYVKKLREELAAEVKQWTNAEKHALLNALRNRHQVKYFIFRKNSAWYESFKIAHRSVYDEFKRIKSMLKQG